MSRALAVGDDSQALEVAEAVLRDGGSALAAVVSGFFAAAGARPGVLLAPLTLLVATGAASGARAFDGRARQPGTGSRRPRGFVDDAAVPPAARAAVPGSLAAVAVALAYAGGGSNLTVLARPGVVAARRAGAPGREALLERVRAVGAAALGEERFARPFLHAAGASEGGVASLADLTSSATDTDQPLVEAAAGWQVPEWAAHDVQSSPELGRGHALLAIDVHGAGVALCFRDLDRGLELEGLDLRLPELGVPVRRGVPRVRPGARLACPAPLAARAVDGTLELAASPAAGCFDPALDTNLVLARGRNREVRARRAG